MRSMFGLAKSKKPGLALLTLIPAFLILSYFSFARSTNPNFLGFYRLKILNQQLTTEKRT